MITKNEHPRFSYIITTKLYETSDMLMKQLPDGWCFYYTDDMDLGSASTGLENLVCVFGLVIDIDEGIIDNQRIAEKLLSELCKSKGKFLDYIDMLAGRFIIIYRQNGQMRIMSDACGMLKIIYDEEKQGISSNIFLLDNFLKNGRRDYRACFLKKAFKYGSLGNMQPLKGLKILTPNHELCFENFKPYRFYPRSKINLHSSNIEDVAIAITHYIQVQESLLKKKYRLFYSCTAGIDSRFTLASINDKSLKENHFFTYVTQDAHVIDAVIAKNMSDKLSLDLTILASSSYKRMFEGGGG